MLNCLVVALPEIIMSYSTIVQHVQPPSNIHTTRNMKYNKKRKLQI